MATPPTNKPSDEQDLSSRKPRRSVIRSLSWKRPSKRTKMEEEAGVDVSIDTTRDSHEGGAGERSFNTTVASSHGMSDEDADDTVFDSSTASSSKKRKKVGVWKTMKRFFSRKSSKGYKTQRSVSDPNLVRPSGERPDVAPLEQIGEVQMVEVDAHPKKAMSHDSLLSELRSKHGNNDEEETSPTRQQFPVVIESPVPDIDWQTSASSTPEKLLPGLNVSHDKIRVAPRHRRAPTRKGVSSVRHGAFDVTDGNVIPRSRSVGSRVPGSVIVEQPDSTTNEQEQKVLNEERKKLREKMKEEQTEQKQEKEEEEAKQKRLERNLEQEKLEEQKREQEKLEQERLEKQKIEEEKLQRERMEQEEIEQQRLEQEKLELESLEQERLEQEKLELERLEQERLEQERLEQEKLEQERLEQEKLEQERLEQEKLEQERLEQERLEQEELEKEKQEKERLEKAKQKRVIKEREQAENLRAEQEKLEKLQQEKLKQVEREQEKLEELKREQEKREDEKMKEEQKQENKSSQYNVQQTIDFSDLAESLRSSGDTKEINAAHIVDVEMKETASDDNAETSKDVGEALNSRDVTLYQNIEIQEHTSKATSEDSTETKGVALYQNIDIQKQQSESAQEEETPAAQNIEVKSATDEEESASDTVVSSLPPDNNVTVSTNQEIRGITEAIVVEPPEKSQPMPTSEKGVLSGSMEGKYVTINEKEVAVPVEDERSPPFSPPLSPVSSATQSSPVRSKKLVIETPEKVYQKLIMPEVRAEGAKEESGGARGQQRQRPQSMHSRIRPDEEMEKQTQDDSNLGVARLTQAFERSSRSQTISHIDRRKKPDILPKPKPASKPGKSQTLERNYRFPVLSSKPGETETAVQKKPSDVVVLLDEAPEKTVKKKESVSSPTKKAPVPKPKPLPKPPKPTIANTTTKMADEGKENLKKTPNTTAPVTNGNVKMSGKGLTESKVHSASDGSKDAQPDLPSFWARRNIFSPDQKTNSTSSPDEKTKEKHSAFIQLKAENCAVCGSKVYQMEKFKVKDNIVHRSCIKCSVCKRLLSVGNFIMSQNKIYCKPHEPHVAVSLTTV